MVYKREKDRREANMKTAISLLALLGLFAVGAALTLGQAASPADSVFPNAEHPSARSGESSQSSAFPTATVGKAEWKELQMRVEAIEARLGAATRPPSITYNLERRLSDLERRVQQIEQTVTRLQSLDARIRKLEMK